MSIFFLTTYLSGILAVIGMLCVVIQMEGWPEGLLDWGMCLLAIVGSWLTAMIFIWQSICGE